MGERGAQRAAIGDARGTTRTLNREAIYDYQYAAASRDYGAVVWMDVRDAIKAKGLTNLSVPREVKVVKEIPKLGTGKVNHRELKTLME